MNYINIKIMVTTLGETGRYKKMLLYYIVLTYMII